MLGEPLSFALTVMIVEGPDFADKTTFIIVSW